MPKHTRKQRELLTTFSILLVEIEQITFSLRSEIRVTSDGVHMP